MKVRVLALAALVASLPLSTLTVAHPAVMDSQNSCLVKDGGTGTATSTLPVVGTITYLDPNNSTVSCPATVGGVGVVAEWASHAPPCPPVAGVVVSGAYCGPVVPAGGTATCTWVPGTNTINTFLTIGFDGPAPGFAPWGNGVINYVIEGEIPVFGPFYSLWGNDWTVSNPYPVDARVIAYPTSDYPLPPGPADVNDVGCTTP